MENVLLLVRPSGLFATISMGKNCGTPYEQAYMGASLGEACSPVVHDGKLILVRVMFVSPTLKYWMLKQEKAVERESPRRKWLVHTNSYHSGKTQIITTASGIGRGGR